MKKEKEKLQKINSSTQNVAGGYIRRNGENGKYSVFDDVTEDEVAKDLTLKEAKICDRLYNKRDEIEKNVETNKKYLKITWFLFIFVLKCTSQLAKILNAKDFIEQKESTIDDTEEYYPNPNSKGLRKKNK